MAAIAHLHPTDTALGGVWCPLIVGSPGPEAVAVSPHTRVVNISRINKYLPLKECVSREKAISVGRLSLRDAG